MEAPTSPTPPNSRRKPAVPPSYTDKVVVVTPVSTGFVLTVAVAKSWHFRSQAEMRRFRNAQGLFA